MKPERFATGYILKGALPIFLGEIFAGRTVVKSSCGSYLVEVITAHYSSPDAAREDMRQQLAQLGYTLVTN